MAPADTITDTTARPRSGEKPDGVPLNLAFGRLEVQIRQCPDKSPQDPRALWLQLYTYWLAPML
jgi:hypothetical protein